MSRAPFLPALPALLRAAAAALALHVGLLAWLDGLSEADPPRPPPARMLARHIALPAPAPPATLPPAPRPRPQARQSSRSDAAVAAPPPPSTSPAAPPPASLGPLPALPAPAVLWHYELRQGEASGEARLSWLPEGAQYRARLERRLAGRELPGWRSEGGLDAQGLAPERFAQQRGGRDSRATNFRRAQGLISFSASSALLPLPDGVQDRLSWMLQLAALVAADPGLREPGAELRLPVVGLGGEVLAWQFVVQQIEDQSLPIGKIGNTVYLRRSAQAVYDSEVEVWLDPARHYLPVRLRHRVGEAASWELRLQQELPLP